MTYVPPEDIRWLPWAPIRDRLNGATLPDDLAYIARRAARKGVIPLRYARRICKVIGVSVEAIDNEADARTRYHQRRA